MLRKSSIQVNIQEKEEKLFWIILNALLLDVTLLFWNTTVYINTSAKCLAYMYFGI